MIEFAIEKDSTSVIIPVSIYDSASTTGGKLTGLVFNTASLTAYYNRMGAAGAATAIALVTATKGTWTSSGFVAIDGTNMPGDYELHLPNAALATGANDVIIQLKGAANMVPVNIHIELIPARLTVAGIQSGLATAAALSTVAGYLDTEIAAILADTNELQTDWANGGRLDLLLDAILADTGTDGVVISSTTANQLADALLNRDMSLVSDTNARTALNALRFLRNKYSISGTTLTVTKEDDTTSAWTSTLTTNASADPVTGSDPA